MPQKGPDYGSWALRKARKDTQCDKPGCERPIKAGSLIRNQGQKRIHATHVRTK